MMKTSADMWMLPLALCFMCVSAYDEQNKEDFCNQDMCETHKLRPSLGSTVLLPCTFTYNNISLVSWNQNGSALLHFSDKYIEFKDPKDGRVSVYPNQQSEGNYSISIDELQPSDLGCYRCEHKHHCFQVELSLEEETLNDITLLIFICSCVAATVILGVGGYCCMKYTMCSQKRTEYNVSHAAGSGTHGVSAPPEEPHRHPAEEQQEADSDDLVYENEDYDPSNQPDYINTDYNNIPGGLHDLRRDPPMQDASVVNPNPNPNQLNFTRGQSQRTKQRFHRELFNRLRQASINRHQYVNQGEIRKQQAMASQEENNAPGGIYKNPIYNRSTDQLHQL
ncbi:uncharacterized protein LOC115431867 [Sphaeramia orbicularis]|uniref:uncharacterized protein LOC115431867 n=1 Tax=Sphaeramia orbicularis TaxID=375764 RepID=UPI00117D1023|nr:uncharacterized protein LOC115431867 [Sphaeramia orbicularis]